MFILKFDIVVLLNGVEKLRRGMDDEILWVYFEMSLDDWIVMVEVFLDE